MIGIFRSPKKIARGLQVREIPELVGDVMHLGALAADEIHRMVVGVAAHEYEKVADPIGDAEPQHLFVELGERLRLRRDEGDMPELERPGADDLLVIADGAPLAEQLDGGALGVLERQHLGQARN